MDELGTQDVGWTIKVFSDFDSICGISKEWDRFVQSVGGDIYLTFDWCRVWWKHYGEGRTLRIYVFWHEQKMRGILPFFWEVVWMGPTWLKVAKVVGADFTVSMVNLALEESHAEVLLERTLKELMGPQKCDGVSLGPLSANYRAYQCARNLASTSFRTYLYRDYLHGPYTIFSLPETFEEYVAQLDAGERRKFRKSSNLAHRSFEWTHDVVLDSHVASSEFEAFVQMHNRQWADQGRLGHFQDWPGGLEFNAEMVTTQAELGRLRLVRSSAGGLVVSYVLCYSFAGRWYARLPARLVGPDWDKFGLGRIGLFKMIELAIDEGIIEIEGGAGQYTHKSDLGAREHSLHTVMFVRRSLSSRLRAILLIHLARLLHFCYYRVWFVKLASRLPFTRKPLWRQWIRTRLC